MHHSISQILMLLQVIKSCLAPEATKPVLDRCRSGPFSIMIDESNDRKGDKRLAVLVRCFEEKAGCAKTRILDMPICNGGTGEKIFSVLDETLRYCITCFT